MNSTVEPVDFFSPTYEVARKRFRDAATAVGAKIEKHWVDTGTDGADFTIDVAILGNANPKWAVVISSGVHGIEGFFGSAVQLAWLLRRPSTDVWGGDGIAILIHAVNPFGFANLRRTNESNIDLNRNFLDTAAAYEGAPNGYDKIEPFLNPASPPSQLEPFLFKALWHVRRYGLTFLKETIAGGQYQFPRGIFFGGYGPATSTCIIRQHLPNWVSGVPRIVHLDFHSGLGTHGRYRLLLLDSFRCKDIEWYKSTFGADLVESMGQEDGTAYNASGTLGDWTTRHLGLTRCRFVTAECGTFPIIRVLRALRAENRAHFFCQPDTSIYKRAKSDLLECFCPRSKYWRALVVERGLQIIDRAVHAQRNG